MIQTVFSVYNAVLIKINNKTESRYLENLKYMYGSPLQCSCLENPRDRGAWWAAVYGVAQSRTRLK